MVLLQNEGGILPLDPAKKTAVIGPLAKNQHDMLGPWWGAGRDTDAVTVFDGINAAEPRRDLRRGLQALQHRAAAHRSRGMRLRRRLRRGGRRRARRRTRSCSPSGETREMSGEAAARSTLDLPGRQEELLRAIKATGKPFAVVLLQRPPARAGGRGRRRARAPRGVVPGRAGGPRGRRRAVRQGQPGRQAARVVPAPARPGADLLQPRTDGPALQRRLRSTTRATATSRAARRCSCSATGSATRRSRSRTCG